MKKLCKKIKDLFDAAKYKRQRNTIENSYNTLNRKYVEVLELLPELIKKETNYENQIKEQKKEIKELKRIIEEDMVPKRKKKGE